MVTAKLGVNGVRSSQPAKLVILRPIRQEILSGLKEPAQYEKLRRILRAFPDLPLTASDFEEAARLFKVSRSKGVQCGAVDLLLCAVAQSMGWTILTFYRALKRCMAAAG